jgi:hypothetical protein
MDTLVEGVQLGLRYVGNRWETCIDTRCETLWLAIPLFHVQTCPFVVCSCRWAAVSVALRGCRLGASTEGLSTIRHLGAIGGKLRKEWEQVAFSFG